MTNSPAQRIASLARDLDQALADAGEAQHRLDMLNVSSQRHAEQVAELRRELSAARSWAWGDYHSSKNYAWFPRSWVTPHDEWALPGWLTTSVEPHLQDWWKPSEPVIHTDSVRDYQLGHDPAPAGP